MQQLFYPLISIPGVLAFIVMVFVMQAKLGLVGILVVYHIWCGKLVMDFKNDLNRHSHVWYRWFNEFPVLILIAVVLLVEFKPVL